MEKHIPKVAVDFDGTVVTHRFPKIGDPIPDALRVLKRLSDAGVKIILWTCRENEPEAERQFLQHAIEYLEDNGIAIRSANKNHDADEFRPPGPNCKVYADIYLDDRNFPVPDMARYWRDFESWCEEQSWLPHEAQTTETLRTKDPWRTLQDLYDHAMLKDKKIWYFNLSTELSNILQYDYAQMDPDDKRKCLWSPATDILIEGRKNAVVVGVYRGYPVVVVQTRHLSPFHTINASVTYEEAKAYTEEQTD